MKKVSISSIIVLLISSIGLFAQKANYKVFPYKSGIVEYKLEGNSKGTHTKYFDEYGYKQADFTESETTVFGFTNKEKSGTILIGPKVYSINYKESSASVGRNPVYETYANSDGADYDKLGREAMASLGFSNTGQKGTIAGKKCEIWEGSLGKIWIWKGLSLKSETIVLGVSITETAVSVRVNESVPSSKFEIPKGIKIKEISSYNESPNSKEDIIGAYSNNPNMSAEDQQMLKDAMDGNMEGIMSASASQMTQEEKDQLKKISNMSYSDFKNMIKKEEPNISDDEIKEAYKMTKEMAKYIK